MILETSKSWIVLVVITILFTCGCHNSQGKSDLPPNIIYIMADDHAWNAIGAYESRLATVNPTPVLDNLSDEGILFTNVFCNNSICTPSRASILTGQYPQTNGVLDLDGRLPADRQYLPKELKNLGYQTAVIGKWHLKDAPEAFDYYKVLPVQGKYFDPVFVTREEGDHKEVIDFHGGVKREVNVTTYEGHSSDIITDLSLDWLKTKRKKEQPFFLMHHYKAPHDDFEYAPRYADYLADVNIPEPKSLYYQPDFGSEGTRGKNDSLRNRIGTSVSDRHPYRSYTAQYGIEDDTKDGATSLAYQEYLKRYLRCVKGVDDNFGKLFKYLKESGLWENTIIIYTSDQGMMLGEHDFIDKRWMYDESMKMPFIVYLPETIKNKRIVQGVSSDLLINNTDFAPTIIELAGGQVPSYMQGMSFANSLLGIEPFELREETYYRYWMHMVHHDVPAHLGIRTLDYKLIYYYGEHYDESKNGTPSMWWLNGASFNIESTPKAWEFYDLSNDPQELDNKIDDPKYLSVIQQLRRRLIEVRVELDETDIGHPHLDKIIEKYWAE